MDVGIDKQKSSFTFNSENIPIIIDNGSYKCRAGWARTTEKEPHLEFRNVLAKPRQDRKKDVIEPITGIQVGNNINADGYRLQLKTQFDRNVVTHFYNQEHIFDYIFDSLNIKCDGNVPHPVLLTEAFNNPIYSRQQMTELLFECYGVPGISYGIDALFGWQRTKKDSDALILSFGHYTTHVVPVLDGLVQYNNVRRLNLGGYHLITYLYKLMQMKNPMHINAITPKRMEALMHHYCSVSLDYDIDIRKWSDLDFYIKNAKRIILPQPIPSQNTEQSLQLLDNANLNANGALNPKSNANPTTSVDNSLGEALLDSKDKGFLNRKRNRKIRGESIAKCPSLTAQKRMHLLTQQIPRTPKFNDDLGVDDEVDAYKFLNKNNEVESEIENDKLVLYVGQHDFKVSSFESCEGRSEQSQLYFGVESIRAPEILFQPNMIGIPETGLVELIHYVLKMFETSEQNRLVQKVFLTGGGARISGLKARLERELVQMRPVGTTYRIFESLTPTIDAWLGARDFANSIDFQDSITTRKEYEEKGPGIFKKHQASNNYCTF